jgi:hypothetical protein
MVLSIIAQQGFNMITSVSARSNASSSTTRRGRAALLLGAAALSLTVAAPRALAQDFNRTVETSGTIALPADLASFNQFNFDLCGCDLAVSLANPGTLVNGGLKVTGRGQFENLASFSTTGKSVLVTDYSGAFGENSDIAFVNSGNLTADLTGVGGSGVDGDALTSFVNRGAINVRGNEAVGASLFMSGIFDNSGLITIEGTDSIALVVRADTGRNSGSIRAVGDGTVGASIVSSSGFTNSGTIEAATTGVSAAGRIRNSGTIRATAADGTAIQGMPGLSVINEAGGVIQGATAIRSGSDPFGEVGTAVANRGVIIGDVDLSFADAPDVAGSNDLYFADAGGVLQGNLRLGAGDDVFVTDLASSATPFAGVSGTIDAGEGYDRVRFRTGQTATTNITSVAGFEGVAYEASGASTVLTLNSAAAVTTSIALTGDGRIDVNADFTADSRPALVVGGDTTAQTFGSDDEDAASQLKVVTRGTISFVESSVPADRAIPAAVEVQGFADFENAGTIRVTEASTNSGFATGVYAQNSAATVRNSGGIELTGGAIGIDGGSVVINSGTIRQVGGSARSTGIADASVVENSGTIEVAGTAVVANASTNLVNSGTIKSTAGPAIRAAFADVEAYALIDNRASGSIVAGAGQAIDMRTQTAVRNAGSITGDVLLSSNNDLFVAEGGTVDGRVDLGAGADNVLIRGATTGITGTLSGGTGIDAFGRIVTASGSYLLEKPSDFENFAVALDGSNIAVALESATTANGGVRVFGSGSVDNRANIAAAAANNVGIEFMGSVPFLGEGTGTVAFTNSGTIDSANVGVRDGGGYVRSFTNNGSIVADGGAVIAYTDFAGGDFAFTNAGRIEGRSNSMAVQIRAAGGGVESDRANFSNSGTIVSGVDLIADNALLTATNSGTIERSSDGGAAIGLAGFGDGLTIDLTNTNRISAGGAGGSALGIYAATGGWSNPNRGLLPECDPITGEPLVPFTAVKVLNSGTISASGGAVAREDGGARTSAAAVLMQDAAHVRAELTNAATGIIEATPEGSTAVIVKSGLFQLVNDGTIRGGAGTTYADGSLVFAPGTSALTLTAGYLAGAIQSDDAVDDIRNNGTIIGSIDLGAGSDTLANSGTITGDIFLRDGNDVFRAGGTINGNVQMGQGDDRFAILAGLTLNGTVDGGEGIDTLSVDLSGGSLSFDGLRFVNFEVRAARLGQGQTATVNGAALDFDTILVDGGTLTVSAGAPLQTAGSTTITGGALADAVVVQAGGTVAGSISLNDGNDSVTNGGAINGDVLLGAGNDTFTALAGGTVGGAIFGGLGTDTFSYVLTGDSVGLPPVQEFESLAINGAGTLSLSLTQNFEALTLNGTGLNVTAANGFSIANVNGSNSAETVRLAQGVASAVSLGGGNDALFVSLAGALPGNLDGGTGTDALNLTLTGASSINTVTGFESIDVTGSSPLTLTGALTSGQALTFDGSDNSFVLANGATLGGTANGGAGRDTLTVQSVAGSVSSLAGSSLLNFEALVAEGAGTLALSGAHSFDTAAVNGGSLSLATRSSLAANSVVFDGANNTLSLASGAIVTGPIDGGAGTDTLAFVQDTGFTRNLGSLNVPNFELLNSSGAGTLNIDRNAAFQAVTIAGGTTSVAAGTTLTAPVTGSASGETLAIFGTVNGNVDLGAGDDRLVLASLANGTGTRVGGAGTDTLELRTAGTVAVPVTFSGQGFSGFENLTNAAGVLSLTGTQSYQMVAVTGGRLIGAAGSTLTAGTIAVSQGAAFGSAGTVNGNIDVRGTLSPGAGTGTMTVGGNVSFAQGSNLLLELDPQAQDRLNVSGTVSIAQGATLDVTGALSNLPGRVLDLVVANGGITGSFTTINKSSTVFGFVAQNGNRIQLRGEFQNDPSLAGNVAASIDYANAVLRSGQAVQAFTAALPRLVDANGVSNEAAFGQLTPEAYASASQIGLQNGLAVTDAARSMALTTPAEAGFYAFGQGLANWADLDPKERTTVGKGDVDAVGLLGGIGFGFDGGARVGAFVGHLDAEQQTGALGAKTEADGLVAGVFGDADVAGFGFHGLVAFNQAKADTKRQVSASQSTGLGSYDLNSWIADVTVDRRFELGRATVLAPKLGLTYVRTEREGVTENGAGAFSLAVQGSTEQTLFADAALTATTSTEAAGMAFTPYAELGIRHRIEGDRPTATARFVGLTGTDSVSVEGAGYGKTVTRLGAGFGLDISGNVRLNGGYGYEMGKNDRHSLTGGLSIRF